MVAEERPRPHAELVHVGLAHQGRPRLPQTAGWGGVVRRREAGEGGGGSRRLDSEGAEIVLGGVRNAVQGPREAPWSTHTPRERKGAIGGAGGAGAQQSETGHVTCGQPPSNPARRCCPKLFMQGSVVVVVVVVVGGGAAADVVLLMCMLFRACVFCVRESVDGGWLGTEKLTSRYSAKTNNTRFARCVRAFTEVRVCVKHSQSIACKQSKQQAKLQQQQQQPASAHFRLILLSRSKYASKKPYRWPAVHRRPRLPAAQNYRTASRSS